MKPQYMAVAFDEYVPEGCFQPLIQLGILESVINFIKAKYVLNLGHNFIVICVVSHTALDRPEPVSRNCPRTGGSKAEIK